MIKEKNQMRDYARAQNRTGEIKFSSCFFFLLLAGEVFFFYIVNFFIFGTLLSCFLRGDREVLARAKPP